MHCRIQLTRQVSRTAERYSWGNNKTLCKSRGTVTIYWQKPNAGFATTSNLWNSATLRVNNTEIITNFCCLLQIISNIHYSSSLPPLNYFQVSLKWANSGNSNFPIRIFPLNCTHFHFLQTHQIWIFTIAKFSVTVSRPSAP